MVRIGIRFLSISQLPTMLPILVNNFVSNLRTLKRPAAAAISLTSRQELRQRVADVFDSQHDADHHQTKITSPMVARPLRQSSVMLQPMPTSERSKALPLPATMMAMHWQYFDTSTNQWVDFGNYLKARPRLRDRFIRFFAICEWHEGDVRLLCMGSNRQHSRA
jgi:hypothetical protein